MFIKYYKRQLFNLCILGISEILFFDVKGNCYTSWKLCTYVCARACVCIYILAIKQHGLRMH